MAVLLFGFWSMIDAHRIAGPMHRLQRLLDEIAGGILTHQISFRKRDEFQDVAASADALVDSYATRLRQVKVLAQAIEGEVVKLPSSQSKELLTLAGDLTAQLEFFKLPEEAL